MSGLRALLADAEKNFQDNLKALEEAHRLQLQETENRQREELDKRIHQDSLLPIKKESSNERQLGTFFNSQTRCRSSSSLASKGTSQQLRKLERTALSSPCVSLPSKAVRTSQEAQQNTVNTQPSYVRKEEEAFAECQKQFHAAPVPSHVSMPLFHDMMKARDADRKHGLEQRRSYLLSKQKPFSFLTRDKEKRDMLMEMLSKVEQTRKSKKKDFTAKNPKVIKDATISETRGVSEQVCMEIHKQLKGRDTSQGPRENQNGLRPRCAERAKQEKLSFLDEKPTFQPKINQQVPDFSRLYKTFQAESQRKAEYKDVTKCKPFNLRTSLILQRQSRMSPEKTQELGESNNLKRSRSLGALTSLSADTLPVYISDAAMKRSMAIRRSVELRDSKQQESGEWMKSYRTRADAMKKAVSLRAKVMDPHSSLKEVYHEKLQQHREADQQRVRDYTRELQNMKARVTMQPFLFERLKQKNAIAQAEQIYRNKLKEVGLNESFVEAKGVGSTPVTCSSEEDSDTERELQYSEITEENVEDGRKIEDVEENSVKSKAEELS